MARPITVGVLAIQGDFAAHARALARWGAEVQEVRRPAQIAEVDGLILPGGETTTMIKLMRDFGLWEAVAAAPGEARPLFGTCAGLILLAQEVIDPPQPSLGLLPVVVRRNAYGRQVDSFVADGQMRVPSDLSFEGSGQRSYATEFVFIRAPRIEETCGELDVLARHEGAPILVRSGHVLGSSFHPELTDDGIVIRLFLAMVARAREQRGGGNGGA